MQLFFLVKLINTRRFKRTKMRGITEQQKDTHTYMITHILLVPVRPTQIIWHVKRKINLINIRERAEHCFVRVHVLRSAKQVGGRGKSDQVKKRSVFIINGSLFLFRPSFLCPKQTLVQ